MLAHFNEAQGKCYEMCEEGLYSSFMGLFLSNVDPSDADNEDSSSGSPLLRGILAVLFHLNNLLPLHKCSL